MKNRGLDGRGFFCLLPVRGWDNNPIQNKELTHKMR